MTTTTTITTITTCSICQQDIDVEINGWANGHNAAPVVDGGRCCSDCNATVVIPRRLEAIYGLQR